MQDRGLIPWRRRKHSLPDLLDLMLDTDDFSDFLDEFETRSFRVDVKETDKEYIVEADLPGCDKNNINVSYDDGVLTIAASYEETAEEKDKNYIRRERRRGNFSRSLSIPEDVKADEIKASFKDGVLKVTLPKSGVAKLSGKVINVE
ncbi:MULTISPECIES: Hsp20/alpha crystallin family protein [Tepidanaerobacter]|uniref:HSP20 family protein n=1 Tax=Tepidanaerobacter syntrophicus TaxID=224999 RepID=A0A0U9I4J5_9FIRM|nr:MULTISPECIES: Hsp20/alpha crystallin family protein [Tepidanaerobacter]GAQ25256.1 HSP20 family protein [Tepidanaerobacter syntrophicus]GLI18746.1 molecular chaperone Hsp20 [Tepidanaerobacter syntrophicus]GLI50822.1 molecular chaperone Hsp20 [Tepidanaerobacter syntrophicus]HHV83659.1 Hsp20/alpha crystallin family protein [Tepidanaerobacter syntrophicus]